LAAWALSLAAVISGIWGTVRLMRSWDVDVVAGWVAGIVLVAGPATQAMGNRSAIGQLLALGVLPWALRVATARWPRGWLRRLGRIVAAGWVFGLLGVCAPPLLVVPAAALFVHALLKPNAGSSWIALGVALAGGLLAVPMLLPWVVVQDLEAYLTEGGEFWTPAVIPLVLVAGVFVTGVVSVRGRQLDAVLLGGVLVVGGAVLARGYDLGFGREVAVSGLAVAALGSAFLTAGALDALRSSDVEGWRRLLGGLSAVAAVVLAALSLVPLYHGRGALPGDGYTEALRFTAAAEGDASVSRILLVGPEDTLPGEYRVVRGAAYRVVSAPVPVLWEVYLPEPTAVDFALDELLSGLIEGEESRAGAGLAAFGIRWVVATGDTPLLEVFDGQLDLVSLGGAKLPTFLVDSETPVRAVASDGGAWTRDASGYSGEASSGGRVFLAETANSRWGPGPWAQVGWGNEVSAADGVAEFDPIDSRRSQAMVAGGLFLFYLLFSAVARRRR